jgi:catechol 2,3-dioxygenase
MTGLPAETAVGRVALRVGDIDGLVEFYSTVVGLDVQHRTGDRAVVGAGGDPLVELHAAPDAPARGQAAGLFHTAVRVPSRGALGAALARIEDGWRLTGASDHHVSEALYLRDPEDNGVEVYCDRPREEWPERGGRVEMDTLPLDREDLREAADPDGASVPEGTDVGHVHLEVTDMAAAREFYVETVGLNVRQAWDGALFVAAGEYHHHVGLNTWNGRTEPAGGPGIEWFELRVPAGALGAARDRLDDADIEVADADGGLAVRDPDAIGVRLRPV